MIAFANKETTPFVRSMWKTCFNDSDQFMDLYFSQKYKEENTLVYFDNGKAVASLQMLSYSITFYGKLIPFAYLSGLCTLPHYRRKGYMDQLIHHSHKVLAQRNIPLAILIPAEDSLYGFYQRYGYEQVFEKDDTIIPLKQLLESYPKLDDAYEAFSKLYRQRDFCVQKTKSDFRAIIDDCILDHNCEKSNLSGMARVIDFEFLLKLYAVKNEKKVFSISVNDIPKPNVYGIKNGYLTVNDTGVPDLEVDSQLLCRLLFGFKLEKLDEKYLNYFSPHSPIMNLMLE